MGQTLFGQDVIKSIGFDESEILRNIIELHCPRGFELDPCYSIGGFYERSGIKKPKHRFDLKPQAKGVKQSNADSLPFKEEEIDSIMFDPPFLATSEGTDLVTCDENSNLMIRRFSGFNNMKELWDWYYRCLEEFGRILRPKGVLVFKCQDTVDSSFQYFSHCEILNMAVSLGFYAKDLFILLAKTRIIGGNHQVQQHARKFHCYYWVFVKKESLVKYSIKQSKTA